MDTSRGVIRWVVAVVLLILAGVSAFGQEVLPGAVLGGGGPAAPEANDAFAGGKALQPVHEKAALIRLDGEVDDMMLKSLQRRVDVARKAGCTLIVYEMDTYGGHVTSAIEISKFTKKLPGQHLNTVAWVHDKAYSAGSMISAACQQIVMGSQGTIGLCAPIAVDGDKLIPLPDTERAKMQDPILQEFDNSAEQNGLDKSVLHAMVVMAIEIHEMHNARTGESKYVDTPAKAKLLAEEAELPGGGKERPWKYVRTIDDDKQLLTVGAADALAMKLSKATINSEPELKAALNIRGELLVLEFNWAERATVFLSTWTMRLLLFVGMLVFAWIEFSHPGLSVAGIAAVLCLVLLVGAPFLTGLAQVWEIALIVLGLAIIIGDVVIFGGLGMLAVPGFILMAIGLVASFVPAEPGGNWIPTMASTWAALQSGLAVLVVGTVLAMISFYVLSRYLYMTPGFNRLQLAPAVAGGAGGGTALRVSLVRDMIDQPADDAVFVGAMGVAASGLRPSGRAKFGEHLVAVVSDGAFIDQGQTVEVIEVTGMRVLVRAVRAEEAGGAGGGPFA